VHFKVGNLQSSVSNIKTELFILLRILNYLI